MFHSKSLNLLVTVSLITEPRFLMFFAFFGLSYKKDVLSLFDELISFGVVDRVQSVDVEFQQF
jgi:hypothetical protein